MSYRAGLLTLKPDDYKEESGEVVLSLPHSCSRWVIGGRVQALALVADLQAALRRTDLADDEPNLGNLLEDL